MGLSDAPDFNLKAIYESNRRQGVQKSQGREKRLVTSHMIKGVRIKNPRSKGAGLRNKGYRITRLSHSGNRWCRFIGCSKMDSQTWLYQLLYPLEVHQTWLGLGNCWSKPVKSLEFSLLTYHTSRHKLLHIMLHSIPIESHGQPCIILVTAECPLKHET